jgi:DNA-binding response OmpR family regulator
MRLDKKRLGGKRLTLRCARCREAFKVEVPRHKSGSGLARVLVAHGDVSMCEAIGDVLAQEGVSFRICHDGSSALDIMEAAPPRVAIIDVALPGLFAFEVVEKVRNRPGLEDVKIILLSSVYNKMAYKRTPSSLYGADDYIEKHHIADKLVPKINRLMIAAVPTAAGADCEGAGIADQGPGHGQGETLPREFVAQTNEKIREAEAGEVSGPASGESLEKAERLARIIVSDIALYNQDRVEEGIRSGTFFELLADEIGEGERLFRERIAPEVSGRGEILKQAFHAFVERRSRELDA